MTGRWLSGLVMYGALVLVGGRLVATHARTVSARAPVAHGALADGRPTHPSLLFGADELQALRRRATDPVLAPLAAGVIARARRLLDAPPIVPSITKRGEPDPPGETKGIASARRLQGRVIDLAMAFTLTRETRFRDAAVALLFDALDRWRIWVDTAHQPPYDLMTGENALTFGLAYDWLYHDLTPDERARLRDGLERRALRPYLDAVTGAKPMFWFTAAHNWNTVCNGGATVLALALAGESDLAPRVLALSAPAMRRYWDHLGDDGGWDEGTGYWGYGHRYGLIAAEALRRRGQAEGEAVFARPGVRQTGAFPIVFAPGRTLAAGFGDSNSRVNDPIFYLLARRYHDAAYVWFADRQRTAAREDDAEGWPRDALALLWRPIGEPWLPEATPDFTPSIAPVARFASIGWAMLAPRQPDPPFFLAFKNGSLAANHTHLDLNTLNVGVGETMVLRELGSRPYPADYFGPKRDSYYEITTAGHNTVLIDDRGQTRGTQGRLEQPVDRPDLSALVGIADDAYGAGVRRARRHIVFVDRRFWVLLDEVEAATPVPVTLRFHTYGTLGAAPGGAAPDGGTLGTPGTPGGLARKANDAGGAEAGRLLVKEQGVAVEVISPEPARMRSAVEEAHGWIRPVLVLALTSAAPATSHSIVTILVPRVDGTASALPAAVERTADTLVVRVGRDRVAFRRTADGWRVSP